MDEMLVRVDLASSPAQELDLSPKLVGTKRSHLHVHEVLGTTGLAPPEETVGELRQGGSIGHECALYINTLRTL